jgi:hypothetical protein
MFFIKKTLTIAKIASKIKAMGQLDFQKASAKSVPRAKKGMAKTNMKERSIIELNTMNINLNFKRFSLMSKMNDRTKVVEGQRGMDRCEHIQ